MIDQTTLLDESLLPSIPLNLSARMRELRSRKHLKQSEIARRMGLDPSIPSLWEQGKRPVPASRMRQLAEALGVSLAELLEGVNDLPGAAAIAQTVPVRALASDPLTLRPLRDLVSERPPIMSVITPMATVVRQDEPRAVRETEPVRLPRQFVPAERPLLVGETPAGWEPSGRVQDIAPSLLDGFWLDPVRLEKPAHKAVLRSRLCEADQALVDGKEVPGAAMAERIYQHCSRQEGFFTIRLPLAESIFRTVLAAELGGMTVDGLVETMRERSSAMPVSAGLLRRLRDTVRAYPVRWVDRDLFGGQHSAA